MTASRIAEEESRARYVIWATDDRRYCNEGVIIGVRRGGENAVVPVCRHVIKPLPFALVCLLCTVCRGSRVKIRNQKHAISVVQRKSKHIDRSFGFSSA